MSNESRKLMQYKALNEMTAILESMRTALENEPRGEAIIVEADPCPWYEVAKGELGVKEKHGDADNPRIIEYHESTTLGRWAHQDATAWCSSFVNWCMEEAGIEGTNSARAKSWLGWGDELDEPREGCVVIIRRGKAGHHVTLFSERVTSGVIEVLGGNQGNAVTYKHYPTNAVLGYRWPEDKA